MTLQEIIDKEAPLAKEGDRHDMSYARGLQIAWDMCQGLSKSEIQELREYFKEAARIDGGKHASIAGCMVTAYLLGIIKL